jgi:hypothetical protein
LEIVVAKAFRELSRAEEWRAEPEIATAIATGRMVTIPQP